MELVVGLGILASLVAFRHVAARRFARGDRRWIWLYFAPTILVPAYVVWAAIRLWPTSPVATIGLGLVGGVSLLLLLRAVRGLAMADGRDVLANPPPAFLNYLIWGALGAPLVVSVLLLVLLVTGGLGNTR